MLESIAIYIVVLGAFLGIGAWLLGLDKKRSDRILKQRMLEFIKNHHAKWLVMLDGVKGDKEVAIKLLSYYFNLIDYCRQVLTKDYSKADSLMHYQYNQWLLSYAKEQNWQVKDMPLADLAKLVVANEEEKNLKLSGEHFYLWLSRSFLEERKSDKSNARYLNNPFTPTEMEMIN